MFSRTRNLHLSELFGHRDRKTLPAPFVGESVSGTAVSSTAGIGVAPGRGAPVSLPLPLPPFAHATRWEPVYNTSGGHPRRISSDPVRPRNARGPPMQQPLDTGVPTLTTPRFYVTGRQPLRPGAILLATVAAVGALYSVLFALGHTGHAHPTSGGSGAARSDSTSGAASGDDEKDDPSQIDTIVLGDPADAPVPARPGDHVSPVHPTILVHLPRFGDQVGLIPDTPAGHLLYDWLAAFNQTSYPALGNALPNVTLAAQIELRKQTGGFNLLSAKEVQPGVLVFRLRDQTPSAIEVLGTLQVRPNSNPAAIASFSLRAVPSRQGATTEASPLAPASPR
jgi:hypothetical protein